MKLVSPHKLIFLFYFVLLPLQSIYANPCLDTDGDGWGWDGIASCRVDTATNGAVDECVDTDGDGWGWDGTASCRVDTTTESTGDECIDTDGDGWGWDGAASCRVDTTTGSTGDECIDTDGDGWGWDGTKSCQMNESVAFEPRVTDPVWELCSDEVGEDSRSAWGIKQVNSSSYRYCVKPCPEGDAFVASSEFPGWGWDNNRDTACAVVDSSNSLANVPLYLPGSAPSRVQFYETMPNLLIAGGGQWQCRHQVRESASDHFTETGYNPVYRFANSGDLFIQHEAGDDFARAGWGFDQGSGTKRLMLTSDPQWHSTSIDASKGERDNYAGNLQVAHREMSIYRTTMDRMACVTDRPAQATENMPLTREYFDMGEVLTPDDLSSVALACREILSFNRCWHCVSNNWGFIEMNHSANPPVRTLLVNPVQVSADYYYNPNRFEFDGTGDSYYFKDGVFNSNLQLIDDIRRYIDETHLVFRQKNAQQIALSETHWVASSGSRTSAYSYSLCQVGG